MYAFMAVSMLGLCYLGDLFLDGEQGYVIIGPALFVGMYSRKIVEKVMGYTVAQAYSGNYDEKSK